MPFHCDQPFVEFAGFMVEIENSGIQGLLTGEMAKDDGFGDSGGGGDFLGGGAFEALAGEEIQRSFEQLAAAVGGRKPGSSRTHVSL